MANIPPTSNPRAYATPLLLAWQKELAGSYHYRRRGRTLLALIKTELARRQLLAAIPTTK